MAVRHHDVARGWVKRDVVGAIKACFAPDAVHFNRATAVVEVVVAGNGSYTHGGLLDQRLCMPKPWGHCVRVRVRTEWCMACTQEAECGTQGGLEG